LKSKSFPNKNISTDIFLSFYIINILYNSVFSDSEHELFPIDINRYRVFNIIVLFSIKYGNTESALSLLFFMPLISFKKGLYKEIIFTIYIDIRPDKNNVYQIYFRNNFQYECYCPIITYLEISESLLLSFCLDSGAGCFIIVGIWIGRYD
jgi:hypothetical protein